MNASALSYGIRILSKAKFRCQQIRIKLKLKETSTQKTSMKNKKVVKSENVCAQTITPTIELVQFVLYWIFFSFFGCDIQA